MLELGLGFKIALDLVQGKAKNETAIEARFWGQVGPAKKSSWAPALIWVMGLEPKRNKEQNKKK